MEEGYTKFKLHWNTNAMPADIDFEDLQTARQSMYKHGLIGWDKQLNVGFGNISKRYQTNLHDFIISGTQTGGIARLKPEHYCLVDNFDIQTNQVWCRGAIKASSESMTHAAVYMLDPKYQAAIHIHHRPMWEYYFDKLPTTDPQAAYGTPEMAKAILALANITFSSLNPMVIMGGHQDGILAFGTDLSNISKTILQFYNAIG